VIGYRQKVNQPKETMDYGFDDYHVNFRCEVMGINYYGNEEMRIQNITDRVSTDDLAKLIVDDACDLWYSANRMAADPLHNFTLEGNIEVWHPNL
jgi:hypothetical protein